MIGIKYNKAEVREKYKELFEHSLDLIYVNDLNGNFLDASDLTLIALGMEREDIPKFSFIDLLDRDNLIKAYKVTKEIRKTGKQSAQSEYKLKTKTYFSESNICLHRPSRLNRNLYLIQSDFGIFYH